MAFQVTATQGTATNNGTTLTVKVLTGATEAGGASAQNFGTGVLSASVNPAGTNSLITCGQVDVTGAVGFTLLGNNTSWHSDVDSTDGFSSSQSWYSGAVTAGTPVTVGSSGPTGASTGYAIYEVLASGGSTPAVDGSSPAAVDSTTTSAQTASFAPPAGAVLVAIAAANGTGGAPNTTMTMSDTAGLGLIWTQRAATATGGGAWVFTTTIPAGGGPVVPRVQAWPGLTWLRWFRRPGFFNQILPVPATATAPAAAAKATAAALNATVITSSAAAAPTFYPGPTWRKHFQWPQQQQLSGPPPLTFASARTATATAAALGANGPFAVAVAGAGSGKYITDVAGRPFAVLGDSMWGLVINAGQDGGATTWQSDIDSYTSIRGGQGFTAFIVVGAGTTNYGSTNVDGRTWDNVVPFVGGDPSVLNETYWQRVDYVVAAAEKHGLTLFLDVAATYAVDFNGAPLNGATQTQYTNYGAAIGARYKNARNLVWMIGDDYRLAQYAGQYDTTFSSILTGIRSTGDTHLVTIENGEESTARFDIWNNGVYPWGTANVTINFCYSYNASYYAVDYAYGEVSPLAPALHGDGEYDDGSGNRVYWRNWFWWGVTSGSRGMIYGRAGHELFQSGTLAALTANTVDNADLGAYRSIFTSFTGWQGLVPDLGSAFVTAGRGTQVGGLVSGGAGGSYSGGNFYVTASITADSSLAMVYLPDATGTITVNPGRLGAGYTATWVDPVSGAQTAATIAATYTQAAPNSLGAADWLLVFQGPPVVPAVVQVQPASPGLTWRRRFQHQQQPVPPAVVAAVTNAPAGLASATGTALGQDTGANIASVAPNATAAAGTGTARGFDTGDALPGVSYPPQQASPSKTWRHFFQHQQQPVPPAPFNVYPTTALATGTALGQDTGANIASVLPNAGNAAATGTSLGQDTGANVASVTVNAAVAAGTGTALDATTALPAAPAQAAYPGAVWRRFFQHPQQPAFQTPSAAAATNASAGLASATAAALGATVIIAPNAGLPAATGAALGQDTGANLASVAAAGGNAAATGTGQNPAPAVTVNAGNAAATGTGADASAGTVSAAAPVQALPGRTWLRQFHHQQQPLPPLPFVAPVFQVARSTATVSDPRDGTATVFAGTTSTAGVS